MVVCMFNYHSKFWKILKKVCFEYTGVNRYTKRSQNPKIIVEFKFFRNSCCKGLSDIESQYRNLITVKWNEYFDSGIPTDSEIFWRKVITIKNAAGYAMFIDISLFAVTMLSLPTSNAVAERTFSIMNIVKCKIRNKMQLSLLNAIMLVRTYFSCLEMCCRDFNPP